MNVQMINKLFPKSKIIPQQSMVEDMVTIFIDLNLLVNALLPIVLFIMIVVVPAVVVGMILH